MQETWVWSLDWEDPLEEGKATHSSILAWRIPMGRGAWWAAVHGVTKNRTWLATKRLSTQLFRDLKVTELWPPNKKPHSTTTRHDATGHSLGDMTHLSHHKLVPVPSLRTGGLNGASSLPRRPDSKGDHSVSDPSSLKTISPRLLQEDHKMKFDISTFFSEDTSVTRC